MDITELLAFSVEQGASDLHLSAGLPPMIRVDGDVRRVNVPAQDHAEVQALVYDIMNDRQRKDLEEFLETDFSFEVPGVARFRVNAFNQHRGAGAVFRTSPSEVLSMETLGMGQVFPRQNLVSVSDHASINIYVKLARSQIKNVITYGTYELACARDRITTPQR